MDVRLGRPAFIEHSNLYSTRRCVSEIATQRNGGGVKKV
jgi:hypothetical protein